MDSIAQRFGIGRDDFREICIALNCLKQDPGAKPAFDGMSGGFKCDDESPIELRNSDHPLTDKLINLLRYLWGYRVSLVRQAPRLELKPYWDLVKELAPNWPGFAEERCSASWQSVADDCAVRAAEFSRGLDELDARIAAQLNRRTSH